MRNTHGVSAPSGVSSRKCGSAASMFRRSASFPVGREERSCVLLVGASEDGSIRLPRAGSLGLHPIVLSNRETNSSGLSVSSVKMDIHSSMELAVDYLRTLGRERLALFGVNPSASSDPGVPDALGS